MWKKSGTAGNNPFGGRVELYEREVACGFFDLCSSGFVRVELFSRPSSGPPRRR
jgi:hypothetical protein